MSACKKIRDHRLLLQGFLSECQSHESELSPEPTIHFDRDLCASMKFLRAPNMANSFVVRSSQSSSFDPADVLSIAQAAPHGHRNSKSILTSSKSIEAGPDWDEFQLVDSDELNVYTHQLASALYSGKPIWL